MLRSIEKIMQSPLQKGVIKEYDLVNLFAGTPAKRYGLVNKAIKSEELLVLRRGLYMLASQRGYFSAYYVANQLVPFSFVTAEAALQFHQWIPERVTQVTSMVAFGRNKMFHNFFGDFLYKKATTELSNFFIGVERLQSYQHFVLMATPLRALADYVYWHAINEANIDFLKYSLRIEEYNLKSIKKSEIKLLMQIYKKGRVKCFLENLLMEKDKYHV